jgi:tripartite-type tricarboxylate transporter receptor subunit TctC
MALPDMKERMAAIGAEPVGSRPEELKRFFREETEKVGALIRALGLKAE